MGRNFQALASGLRALSHSSAWNLTRGFLEGPLRSTTSVPQQTHKNSENLQNTSCFLLGYPLKRFLSGSRSVCRDLRLSASVMQVSNVLDSLTMIMLLIEIEFRAARETRHA